MLRTALLGRGARRKNDYRLSANIFGPADAGGACGEMLKLPGDCQRDLWLYPENGCHCFFVCRQGREPGTGNGSRFRGRAAADQADEMRGYCFYTGGKEKSDETNQPEACENCGPAA